jgi:isopenicillin-N N-acyltransferase-like protein
MLRFEWAGTPAQIGQQHGEDQREAIRTLVAWIRSRHSKVRLCDGRSLSLDDYLGQLLIASSVYAPALADELDGIAAGAGMTAADVMALNAFLELIIVGNDPRDDFSGCTSFAFTPPATSGGAAYLGQNLDIDATYGPHVAVAAVKPTHSPEVLVVTIPGVVGCLGLNEAGLGVTINFLHANDVGIGVCIPFVVRQILAQVRPGDAIGAATVAARACGAHYHVATSNGVIAGIETSGRDYDVHVTTGGRSVHANHYLAERMRRYDDMVSYPTYRSSITRRGSTIMRQCVAEGLGADGQAIALADLVRACQDHENYPFSVCFHADEHPEHGVPTRSVASAIMRLDERKLWISDGSGHSPYTTSRIVPAEREEGAFSAP